MGDAYVTHLEEKVVGLAMVVQTLRAELQEAQETVRELTSEVATPSQLRYWKLDAMRKQGEIDRLRTQVAQFEMQEQERRDEELLREEEDIM